MPQLATWADKNRQTLIQTGCNDVNPIKAAAKFADLCIRKGWADIHDGAEPGHPVGYYRVDDGLYRQADVHGVKRQPSSHRLTLWMTWRWRLLRQATEAGPPKSDDYRDHRQHADAYERMASGNLKSEWMPTFFSDEGNQ